MAFFESLSKKVGEAAQATAKKSGEIIETTKMNLAISSEEDKIQKAFAQIGKLTYENYSSRSNEELDFSGMFEAISASEQAIRGFREKIMEIKNIKVCNSCGNEIDRFAPFCAKCGAKVETPEASESSAKVCKNCNATIASDSPFCSSCGTKVE